MSATCRSWASRRSACRRRCSGRASAARSFAKASRACSDRAERLVFVLGDPAYYGRFGFTVMEGFVSRYAGPYFQALMLAPDAPKAGRVSYPKAFDDLG